MRPWPWNPPLPPSRAHHPLVHLAFYTRGRVGYPVNTTSHPIRSRLDAHDLVARDVELCLGERLQRELRDRLAIGEHTHLIEITVAVIRGEVRAQTSSWADVRRTYLRREISVGVGARWATREMRPNVSINCNDWCEAHRLPRSSSRREPGLPCDGYTATTASRGALWGCTPCTGHEAATRQSSRAD